MKLVTTPPRPHRYRLARCHVFNDDGACVLRGLVENARLKSVRRWRIDKGRKRRGSVVDVHCGLQRVRWRGRKPAKPR
eukprot:15449536-Alexandrium_andersonii.AAC.1